MRLTLKYSACALVVLLAVAVTVLFAVVRADSYGKAIDSYLAEGQQFTISDVSPEQTGAVQAYLQAKITEQQAVLFRADDKLSGVDGSVNGIHLGVLADPTHLEHLPELDYLGTSLFTHESLATLLTSERGKTLGLYKVSEDTLSWVPEVSFAPGLSLGKMTDMIETTGTVNGRYTVYGFDEQERADFLRGLSAVTGNSEEQLLHPLSGGTKDAGLLPVFSVIAVLVISGLLTLVFFIHITQGVRELGTYLILGWAKTDYLILIFKPVFYCMFLGLAITGYGGWITLHGFSFSPGVFFSLIYPFALTVCIVLISFLLSSLVIVGMKPIHAVRGYTPQKLFTTLLALAFIAISAGLYVAASYLDGPLREVSKMAKVQEEWGNVADQYILYSQSAGADSVSFSGQSTNYAADFYRWYSSIENEDGVSLVNTYYVDHAVLEQWAALGEEVPNREFWYMAASPSYLQSVGVQLSEDTLRRVEDGQQVFLIPEYFATDEQSSVSRWAQADALRRGQAEQDISTAFTRDPVITVESYVADDEGLFTWNTDSQRDFRSRDVVIYVATSANMTYFESESLAASGLEDSYVKLSSQAVEKYASATYLSQYGLEDNHPVFISSQSFVAGLQKSISQFIQLFGVVVLLLGLLTAFALASLMNIYSLLNSKSISVRRLLGHPLWRLFKPAYLLVIMVNFIGLVSMALAVSRVGLLVALIMLIVQPVLLYLLARKFAYANMVSLIKES